MKPDGLVEVQWGQAQSHVCNPAGGNANRVRNAKSGVLLSSAIPR